MLGLMGPLARDVLSERHRGRPVERGVPVRYAASTSRWRALRFLRSECHMWGSSGWELYIDNDVSVVVYDALVAAGAPHGLVHAGYHAMNSLRLEAGMRHWGHDITDEDTPLEAGLGFAIAWDKDADFNGRAALVAQRGEPRTKRLIQFRVEDPDLLSYHDEPIYRDGVVVGRTASSMWSATQDRCCAMGYVEHDEAITKRWLDEASSWEMNIGGRRVPVSTSIRSWYDPKNERVRL